MSQGGPVLLVVFYTRTLEDLRADVEARRKVNVPVPSEAWHAGRDCHGSAQWIADVDGQWRRSRCSCSSEEI